MQLYALFAELSVQSQCHRELGNSLLPWLHYHRRLIFCFSIIKHSYLRDISLCIMFSPFQARFYLYVECAYMGNCVSSSYQIPDEAAVSVVTKISHDDMH